MGGAQEEYMSNSTDVELRKTVLVACKGSKVTKAEPGDGVGSLPLPDRKDSQSAAGGEVPDSWTKVIENPKLWRELRTLFVESE